MSKFFGDDWISLNPENRFYVSTPRGDQQSSARFRTSLPSEYPLAYYRTELKRDDLRVAKGQRASRLNPKVGQLAWDRTVQYIRNPELGAIGRVVVSIPLIVSSVAVLVYESVPEKAKPFVWPFLLFVFAGFVLSWMWLFRPAFLTEWALRRGVTTDLPLPKRIVGYLDAAAWLGLRSRPLEAWLRAHYSELVSQCFEERAAVRDRRTYVDLGNAADLDAWSDDINKKRRALISIHGPGGCGKTTLAIECANRARKDTAQHPVLPILVDEDWVGTITEYVAKAMTREGRAPTTAMVEKLGAAGGIALIVDGLSERRVGSNPVKQVRALVEEKAFKTVITTSRTREAISEWGRRVEVGPLGDERLREFVESYVTDVGKTADIVSEVRKFSRGHPIRPLFARLAIDHVQTHLVLPETGAQLIQAYVMALRSVGGMREDDFLRASRLAARACVWETLACVEVPADYLRGQISAEASKLPFLDETGATISSATILDQLVTSGLMQRNVVLASPRVKFVLDPVAEYLMAMDAVSGGATDHAALMKRIEAAGESAAGLAEVFRQVSAWMPTAQTPST